MADVPPTVDFDAVKLDRVIEGYLCGADFGAADHDSLRGASPHLAEELDDFVRDDAWMRRLAGSKRLDHGTGQRPNTTYRGDTPCAVPGADAQAASTFGDYELLAEIGRGGMGVVYKARQRSLNRVVALKMIRSAQLASKLEVQRFYAEAESAAHLDHAGIVPVYAAGEHEGRHYYSMGFVEGISLHELLADETMLPAREAAELVRRVAEAIHYAHRRGVIHRDLKPANILLAESEQEDAMQLPGPRDLRCEPKVTDFGLAKKIEADSELTGTGQILGTPGYMAPEQAAGQSDQIGPHSDVYSLGAVLYCLLTGRPPFRAANAVQTMQQVLQDEPVPPRRVNSAVPRDLETICLKCLEKNPARRYGSAQELAADLKRFRDGEPIAARPVDAWERAAKWIRRYPTAAALAVVGLMMAMALVGLGVSQHYRAKLERTLYSRLVLGAHEAWRNYEITRAQDLLKECREHLRGWEWGYVDRLCRTGFEKTLKQATLRNVPVAADNMRWSVYVLDAATGREIVVLKDFDVQVTGVQFSQDGQQLWTASANGTLTLWDLPTRRAIRTMAGDAKLKWARADFAFPPPAAAELFPPRPVEKRVAEGAGNPWFLPRIAYSPDGSRLATGYFSPTWVPEGRILSARIGFINSEGEIETWNAEKLADAVVKGHSDKVREVTFSPDRQLLASVGNDGAVKLWDVPTCRHILDFEGHVGPVLDVCFSPDGKRLASGGNDLTVRIWDVLTGRLMLTFGDRVWPVSAPPFVVAPGGGDGHVRPITGVAFHPDGGQVASIGADPAIKIWNVGSGSESVNLRGPTATGFVKTLKRVVARGPSHIPADDKPWSVSVLDAATGREIVVLESFERQVVGVQFHSDGQQLWTESADGTLNLWDLKTRQVIRTMSGEPRQEVPLPQVALRPTHPPIADPPEPAGHGWYGSPIALSAWFVWADRPEPAGHRWYRATQNAWHLPRIAYSPDGSRLATGFFSTTWLPEGRILSNRVAFINPEDGAIETLNAEELRDAVLKGHSDIVREVAFSPDRQRLASVGNDAAVKLWDVPNCRFILDFEGHIGPVIDVCFSPDGKRLATGGNDLTVRIWDVLTGRLMLTLGNQTWMVEKPGPSVNHNLVNGPLMPSFDWGDGHVRPLTGIAFHPEGGQVASVGADPAIKTWNVGSGSEDVNLRGHTGPVQSIAFHPDGALLASAGDDGVILLWNPHTKALVRTLQAHDKAISALAFSPDGRLLASASHDWTVKIWHVATGAKTPSHTLHGHKGRVYGVSFSADGRLLASAGHDGTCILWNVATGQRLAVAPRSAGPVFSAAFDPHDPHGRSLAMGGYDLAIRNLEQGKETLLTDEQDVFSVAFSPDGRRLASGNGDGTVRVWRAGKGKEIAVLQGHQARVTSVVFSPAGDRIASTSWDGSVKVWDPESEQETLSLKGEGGRAYCVAFSPDGRRLASANHDGTITLWGR